jgi:hypothetical protein
MQIGDNEPLETLNIQRAGERVWQALYNMRVVDFSYLEDAMAGITSQAIAASCEHIAAAALLKYGWRPIAEMPERKFALVGRWCGPSKPYWHEVRANWFMFGSNCGPLSGTKSWSYETHENPSPFYDENGNYAKPQWFCEIPSPPEL